MSILDIIAAAETTSNNWVQELTNGSNEAILTFKLRKTADEVARQLKAEGATVNVHRTEYKEYMLVANWR